MQAAQHSRREFLVSSAAALTATAQSPRPTRFQIACMMLPYSQFPIGRPALAVDAPPYQRRLTK